MKEALFLLLKEYGLRGGNFQIKEYGSGHIHKTFLVYNQTYKFIGQLFNKEVFKYPERISANQRILLAHLQVDMLPFVLPLPLKNKEDKFFSVLGDYHFRLFPYVDGINKDVVSEPREAAIAAEAFARFIAAFLEVPIDSLQETIPDFHLLSLRYSQLEESIRNTKIRFDKELKALVDFYLNQYELDRQYLAYQDALPLRVTHNDTKINNLIFENDLSRVNALIDLDTIMPGYVYYDFGDLVRTVACSEDESSRNWNNIYVDLSKYNGLVQGFCKPLLGKITEEEIHSLPYGGEMMTYIMGLRFLADFLNGNVYYQISYPEQNFHRAKNQSLLLQSLQQNRGFIQEMISSTLLEKKV